MLPTIVQWECRLAPGLTQVRMIRSAALEIIIQKIFDRAAIIDGTRGNLKCQLDGVAGVHGRNAITNATLFDLENV